MSRYNNINNALWLLNKAITKHPTTRDEKISFNTVVTFYEKNKKENLQNNELFVKMFIMIYKYFLKHYNASIFDTFIQKEIYNLLDKPVSFYIEKLKDDLNESEIYNYIESKGVDLKHPATKKEDQKQKDLSKIDIKELTKEHFDFDTVQDNIFMMINNYLNYYNK